MPAQAFDLILGTKNWSSWSLRAWLMLRQCGVPFDETMVQLRREDMQSNLDDMSPSGLVPVLRHEDLLIWDSLSIAEYVAELFPTKNLWPEDRAARAIARSVSAEMHSGFISMRQTMPMDFLAVVEGFEPDEETTKNIERIKSVWADCRQRFGGDGVFLFGAWSHVDSMFAPVVSRFTTYGIELDDQLSAYVSAVWQTENMQLWKQSCIIESADL